MDINLQANDERPVNRTGNYLYAVTASGEFEIIVEGYVPLTLVQGKGYKFPDKFSTFQVRDVSGGVNEIELEILDTGALELIDNRTNVTVATHEVNQAAGSSPWTCDAPASDLILAEIEINTRTPGGSGYGALTVGSTYTLISGNNADNRDVGIVNNGSKILYLATNSLVTVANGIPLAPGQMFSMRFSPSIYGIVSSGTCEVRYIRTTK